MCYIVNFWIQTFIVRGLGSPLRSVEAPSLAMNALPMGLHRRPGEQFFANHKQVHQSAGGKQPVGVLRQSSVAHLHEPELQLHPNTCSTLLRTLDLFRFLARSTSSTRSL